MRLHDIIRTAEAERAQSAINEIQMLPKFDRDSEETSSDNLKTWFEEEKPRKVASLVTLDLWSQRWPIWHDHETVFLVTPDGMPAGYLSLNRLGDGSSLKHQVSHAYLEPAYRGGGDAYAAYELLVKKGKILFSDTDQTRLSRKVWQRLAAAPDIDVWICDAEGKPIKQVANTAAAYRGDKMLMAKKATT